VSRRKRGLFHFSEVVGDVLVQDHVSDGDQWVVLLGHRLGDVENVDLVLESVLLGHGLDEQSPLSSLAALDVVEEVLDGVIGFGTLEGIGLLSGKVLDALLGSEVELDPVGSALFVDPSEGVRGVAVHVPETIGGSSVREQDRHLVGAFRNK
jgi:hypothetical protein